MTGDTPLMSGIRGDRQNFAGAFSSSQLGSPETKTIDPWKWFKLTLGFRLKQSQGFFWNLGVRIHWLMNQGGFWHPGSTVPLMNSVFL